MNAINDLFYILGLLLSDIHLATTEERPATRVSDSFYENLPTKTDQSDPINDLIDGSLENPIPKPPRSPGEKRTEPGYMNLNEYREQIIGADAPEKPSKPEKPSRPMDFDIDLLDRLDNFASALSTDESDAEFPRPLPPIPDTEETDGDAGTNLSSAEIEELYATVDKSSKRATKEEKGDKLNTPLPESDVADADEVEEAAEQQTPTAAEDSCIDAANLEEGRFRIKVRI